MKHNIQIASLKPELIAISGKDLSIEWIDKGILIYSTKDYRVGHPITKSLAGLDSRITKLEKTLK